MKADPRQLEIPHLDCAAVERVREWTVRVVQIAQDDPDVARRGDWAVRTTHDSGAELVPGWKATSFWTPEEAVRAMRKTVAWLRAN